MTGDKCIYRHALPPGYVLKSQKNEEEEEKITLEEYIETARNQLPPSSELKPVTTESFAEWHAAKKSAEAEAEARKKEIARERGTITGREFFLSGEYKEDEEDQEGEDWDLSQFRRALEETVEEGEYFQVGPGNPRVDGETVLEDDTEKGAD